MSPEWQTEVKSIEQWWERHHGHHARSIKLSFGQPGRFTVKGNFMSVTLTNTQQVIVTAQALDASGNQVSFTAPPTFSVGNTALANLVPLASTDPTPPTGQYAMWLVPISGQIGSDTVTVSEDAVLGDSTTLISGTGDYTVTASTPPPDLATSVAVTFGTPVAQPVAATSAFKSAAKK
jgi:hypothetical protein